jgi:hypothetical protein
VSCAVALLSASLWFLAYGNLIDGVFHLLVEFLAWPAAVAGVVVGTVATVRRRRPRAVAVLGVVLGLLATAYITFGILKVLATAAFA